MAAFHSDHLSDILSQAARVIDLSSSDMLHVFDALRDVARSNYGAMVAAGESPARLGDELSSSVTLRADGIGAISPPALVFSFSSAALEVVLSSSAVNNSVASIGQTGSDVWLRTLRYLMAGLGVSYNDVITDALSRLPLSLWAELSDATNIASFVPPPPSSPLSNRGFCVDPSFGPMLSSLTSAATTSSSSVDTWIASENNPYKKRYIAAVAALRGRSGGQVLPLVAAALVRKAAPLKLRDVELTCFKSLFGDGGRDEAFFGDGSSAATVKRIVLIVTSIALAAPASKLDVQARLFDLKDVVGTKGVGSAYFRVAKDCGYQLTADGGFTFEDGPTPFGGHRLWRLTSACLTWGAMAAALWLFPVTSTAPLKGCCET